MSDLPPMTPEEFMVEMGRLIQRCGTPVFGVVAFATEKEPEAVTVAQAYGMSALRIGICLALISDKSRGMVEQFARQMPPIEGAMMRRGFRDALGLAVDDSDAAEGTTFLREANPRHDPPKGGRLG